MCQRYAVSASGHDFKQLCQLAHDLKLGLLIGDFCIVLLTQRMLRLLDSKFVHHLMSHDLKPKIHAKLAHEKLPIKTLLTRHGLTALACRFAQFCLIFCVVQVALTVALA